MVKLLIVMSVHIVSLIKEMLQLTTEQSDCVVLTYTQTQSVTAVQNAFEARFPDRNPPTKKTIR